MRCGKFGAACVPSRPSRTVVSIGERWLCQICDVAFDSPAALASHCTRRHWHVCEARWYVRGTLCPVCCLECHTRSRVVQHISHSSPVCLANLCLRGVCLTWEEVVVLDQAELDRVRSCHAKAHPAAAFRPSLPDQPVLRPDGTWFPGDSGHPLGSGRRWLLHMQNA